MNEVLEGAREATERMKDVAKALTEGADSMKLIDESVAKVAEVVDNNSASSEETAAVSEEQAAQVQTMVQLVEKFEL